MKKDYLYKETENQLLEMINGLDIGDKLLPERQLVEKFDVSMITLKHALSNLSDNGFIRRIAGRGTFVLRKQQLSKQKKPVTRIFTWEDFGAIPNVKSEVFENRVYYKNLDDAIRKNIAPDLMLIASKFPFYQEKGILRNLEDISEYLPSADKYFNNLTDFFSEYSFRFGLPMFFSCNLVAASTQGKYKGLAEKLQSMHFEDYVDFVDYIYSEFKEPSMFFPEFLQMYLQQTGIQFFNSSNGENLFDNKTACNALKKLKKSIDKGRILNPFEISIQEQTQLFKDGKKAVIGPIFTYNLIELGDQKEEILPPFGKPGTNRVNVIGLTLHNDTKFPEESAKVLSYLCHKDMITKMTSKGTGFPAEKALCEQFLSEKYPLISKDYQRFEKEINVATMHSNSDTERVINSCIINASIEYMAGRISLSEAAKLSRSKLSHLVDEMYEHEYLKYIGV